MLFKNLGLKNMSKTQPSTPTVKERSVFWESRKGGEKLTLLQGKTGS